VSAGVISRAGRGWPACDPCRCALSIAMRRRTRRSAVTPHGPLRRGRREMLL